MSQQPGATRARAQTRLLSRYAFAVIRRAPEEYLKTPFEIFFFLLYAVWRHGPYV